MALGVDARVPGYLRRGRAPAITFPRVLAYRALVMVTLRRADIAKIANTSDGLLLVTACPRPAPCEVLPLDGTDDARRHGQGSRIRRPVSCRSLPRLRQRPCRIVDRAVA
jgi:hypothetical protein